MSIPYHVSDVERMEQIVALWSPEEREWWRELIAVAPKEAILVMDLVLRLDAKPIKEDA